MRRLALFETDGSRPEILGPYQYEIITVDKAVFRETYDLSAVKSAPERPVLAEGEELSPHTGRWWQFMDWQRYRQAVAHEVKRLDSIEAFVRWWLAYILEHCVKEADRTRITTIDDWAYVLDAVAIPRVTQESLAVCLASYFKASYNGQEIFDALERIADEESKSAYDVMMTWEIETINEAGMSFDEWMDLPYLERTQRVAARILPRLNETLTITDRLREKK